MRRLEIGPGHERLEGFETLNVYRTPFTDHVGRAQSPPFPDNTFVEVYSSHCIEHVDWWEVEKTIAEWVRILKPDGWLEVHTIDATPHLKTLLEWERTGKTNAKTGAWRADLHQHDPYVHAVGRLLCYSKKGDGGANIHRALITPRYLKRCFENAGLVDLEKVPTPRGSLTHKTVNMGLRGRKP